MLSLKLISPDDGSVLQASEDSFIDSSGNIYPIVDGVPDLRPRRLIKGVSPFVLQPHQVFRSFDYKKQLKDKYLTHRNKADSFKSRMISGFVPPPESDAKCLDHGCGNGELRSYLTSCGFHYTGIDDESGTTTAQGGGERFRGGATHLCDLHKLPFLDDTFQFIVSYSVFEHLQNPFVAAAELFRVMKPGGVSFVAVASAIPFHMDSFYHHTHFGVLSTFLSAGFNVEQVAGADWNAYIAISDMDGFPGPSLIRQIFSRLIYLVHRFLWWFRSYIKGKDYEKEELRRHLMMAGITKAIIAKPH